jgi:hypothetical protein
MALLQNKGNSFSSARRTALGFVAALLLVYAWLHFTHAAVLGGIGLKDMDWDNDGHVGVREIGQAFYAVEASKTVEGSRHCTRFAWHTGETIRVECRTEFAAADSK